LDRLGQELEAAKSKDLRKASWNFIGEAIFSHGVIERRNQHRADRGAMAASIPASAAAVRWSTLFALPLITTQET